MTTYTRPEPTAADELQAKKDAEKLIRKYGMNNLGKMLAYLCLENAMLTREINEHRAAREIEPLKTYEV